MEISIASNYDAIGLYEALEKLAPLHPRKASLVKLRFFADLTVAQAAHAGYLFVATAENDWVYARSWLRLKLGDKELPEKIA